MERMEGWKRDLIFAILIWIFAKLNVGWVDLNIKRVIYLKLKKVVVKGEKRFHELYISYPEHPHWPPLATDHVHLLFLHWWSTGL
jgi:hypothetical protein